MTIMTGKTYYNLDEMRFLIIMNYFLNFWRTRRRLYLVTFFTHINTNYYEMLKVKSQKYRKLIINRTPLKYLLKQLWFYESSTLIDGMEWSNKFN